MKEMKQVVVTKIGPQHLTGISVIFLVIYLSFDDNETGGFQLENGAQIVAGKVSISKPFVLIY